jgi:hypothetical protein
MRAIVYKTSLIVNATSLADYEELPLPVKGKRRKLEKLGK